MGGKKLYLLLQPFMLEHQIKLGRDALFDLLASNNLLVRRQKRKVYTTNSFHWLRKYPNLIKTFIPEKANQLWASDITYWKVGSDHLYISFITDVYSHKIVGYQVAETLAAIESVEALRMALKSLDEVPENLIHHSDRGIQYCSSEYVKLLQGNGIQISMTESGDPLENPVAERINGIIKDEYLECYEVNSLTEAKSLLTKVVELYNEERPHLSNGNETPSHVHLGNPKGKSLWKKPKTIIALSNTKV